jgi:hypothetical protein
VAADWWYTWTRRDGSGVLASIVGASSFTMWPKNDGSSTSPTRSVGWDLGFANWPAIRPTFTSGNPDPKIITTDICRKIFSFSRIDTALKSRNDSAHSPAWSRKAWPPATSASAASSARASPAKTSGGIAFNSSSAARARTSSGQ